MDKYDDELVSVIITTYKRPVNVLKRAVESALNQTYNKIEIIVVNDCPSEKKLVEDIRTMLTDIKDNRIKYIVHEQNQGACRARNTGIELSQGSFIALLDDDDEWLPQKIEHQLKGFKNEEIGMVYSPFFNVTDELPGELCVRGTKSGYLLDDLLWTNCIGGSSMPIIKKEVFEKCGLFDENLLSSQDYDMWIRIAERYKIECVNEPLTYRYVQNESITNNFSKQKQGFELFTKKHIKLYNNNKKALNYRLNRRVNKYIEQGHFKEAFNLYKQALSTKLFAKYNCTEPIKGFIKFLRKKRGKYETKED